MRLGKRDSEVLDAISRGVVWRVLNDDGNSTWFSYCRSDPQPEGHGWAYVRWANVTREVARLMHLGLAEVSGDPNDMLTEDGGESTRMLLALVGVAALAGLRGAETDVSNFGWIDLPPELKKTDDPDRGWRVGYEHVNGTGETCAWYFDGNVCACGEPGIMYVRLGWQSMKALGEAFVNAADEAHYRWWQEDTEEGYEAAQQFGWHDDRTREAYEAWKAAQSEERAIEG